jgi:hypothetical protein
MYFQHTKTQISLVLAVFVCVLALLMISMVLSVESNKVQAQGTVQNFYVATNGSDSNAGTISSPWRNINFAANNNSVGAGDTVYIRGGTYNESISARRSGTPGSPVTFRNYPGETPIVSDAGAAAQWRWQMDDQSNVHIIGLTFKNYEQGGMQIRAQNNNIANIIVSDNIFEDQKVTSGGTGRKGLQVTTFTNPYQISNITIRNNTFRNIDTGAGSGSAGVNEVMPMRGNITNLKIIGNRIDGASNIGIDLVGRGDDSGRPHNVLIQDNHVSGHGFRGGASTGIYLDGADRNIIIENNLIENGPRGIRVNVETNAPASFVVKNVIIRNNTLHDNAYNLLLGSGSYPNKPCGSVGNIVDSVAVHNTLVSTVAGNRNVYFGCGENLRWKNNLYAHTNTSGTSLQLSSPLDTIDSSTWKIGPNFFYNKSGDAKYEWKRSNYSSLSAFQAATGFETTALEANPLFVNETSNNFDLSVNSPARNTASSLTNTQTSGSGTNIPVKDARYFTSGFGVKKGDSIRVGSNSPVTVTSVNYGTNTLTVTPSISWNNTDPVAYNYDDAGPNFGVEIPTEPCHQYTSSDPVLVGWGAAYNTLSSAKELLISGVCTDGGIEMVTGNNSQDLIIYKTGYELINNIWQPFTLSGQTYTVYPDWLLGLGIVFLPRESSYLQQDNPVITYICQFVGGQAKCGCSDSACSTKAWQVQIFNANQ